VSSIGQSVIELEATINATVACAAWLVHSGEDKLACDMRDDFIVSWMIPPQMWNVVVDKTIEYIRAKGDTPVVSEEHYRAIRL